jgi:quercetin dioxygenase-like cupin family protein
VSEDGAVPGPVQVIRRDDVPPIDLTGGSWSRLLLTGASVGATTTLGCSSFAPGTQTASLSHATDELAYVVSGSGELWLEDRVVAYGPDSALFIPAGVWHVVANRGTEPVVMVFAFPGPDYPPTERRPGTRPAGDHGTAATGGGPT